MVQKKIFFVLFLIGIALAFLFSGKGTLADVFYFLGGVVGAAAFIKARSLENEMRQMKERVSQRFGEVENRINKLDSPTAKRSATLLEHPENARKPL